MNEYFKGRDYLGVMSVDKRVILKYISKLAYAGIMLHARRSRVRLPMRSLDFSIDLTLPAAL
jgi:hypothetical protein